MYPCCWEQPGWLDRMTRGRVARRGTWLRGGRGGGGGGGGARGCCHDITRLLWGLKNNSGLEHGGVRVRTIC